MLEEIFGEDLLNRISFANDDRDAYMCICESLDEEAANLYYGVYSSMEREFAKKYYQDIENYGGILGPIKKTNSYSKLDYSEAHELINEYKRNIKSSRT